MWLQKWKTPVWKWSSTSVTELFFTRLCFNMGILHVVYLWKSHISGQQGEKLPFYLLPSCWASVMLDLVAGRQEGPWLLWKEQQNRLTVNAGGKGVSKRGRSMRGETNSGWNREPVSADSRPRAMLQGFCKENFHIFFSRFFCCLVSTKTEREVLLDFREMGEGTTVQRPHFLADLRLPYLQLPCFATTHKIHTEALWHV